MERSDPDALRARWLKALLPLLARSEWGARHPRELPGERDIDSVVLGRSLQGPDPHRGDASLEGRLVHRQCRRDGAPGGARGWYAAGAPHRRRPRGALGDRAAGRRSLRLGRPTRAADRGLHEQRARSPGQSRTGRRRVLSGSGALCRKAVVANGARDCPLARERRRLRGVVPPSPRGPHAHHRGVAHRDAKTGYSEPLRGE